MATVNPPVFALRLVIELVFHACKMLDVVCPIYVTVPWGMLIEQALVTVVSSFPLHVFVSACHPPELKSPPLWIYDRRSNSTVQKPRSALRCADYFYYSLLSIYPYLG
jgi:hypothetical protein